MKRLVKFIKDNKLIFAKGQRNTNLVPLCGYACYLELDEENIQQALEEVKVVMDGELLEELSKVYDYADWNDYANYWTSDSAKDQFTFETLEED